MALHDFIVRTLDGSASAPAWSFVGDTNTGVYRSGADTLVLVTGGTAAITIGSTQGVTLSSTLSVTGTSTLTGNVGIGGASNPSLAVRVINGGTLTTAGQVGVKVETTFSSAATSYGTAVLAQVLSAAATFTMAEGIGLRVANASKGAGSTITTQYGVKIDSLTSGATNWALYTAGTTASALGGSLYIGDTANANATLGLTINQGANDDEILALKSSDVAHGVTNLAETDTYFMSRKYSATAGGARLVGISSGTVAVELEGTGTTDVTTKATTSVGYVNIVGRVKSGASVTDAGADANLAVIRNNATTRFIFDAEGSAHADVEWVAF